MQAVCALQGLDAVVLPPDQERRLGEPGEVGRLQLIGVEVGQCVVGRDPLTPLVGLAGPRQIVDHAHRTPPLLAG